jgi:hypothetical protein
MLVRSEKSVIERYIYIVCLLDDDNLLIDVKHETSLRLNVFESIESEKC